MMSRLRFVCLALLLLGPSAALAGPAPFDLTGPRLQVTVTHAGRTLPISQTPNLSAGDQLLIKTDLPKAQSVHYLLIAAFLRGATNPPPENWFASLQTWSRKGAGGLKVTVPQDAQQLLLFLAPETGGDFKAVVNAVRSRPGAFVRASQDLNQATLDRSRLDAYLAAIRKLDHGDPDDLKTASPLLARSLTIKLDPNCLVQAAELRASCLTQGQDSLVLNDGQSVSMVQALTSGYSADLMEQLSATPRAGSGYYSPYIASVIDIAHIFDSFHTAQYQYIPALATEQDDRLSLMLNAAPSFQNPKSVLVIALPAVEAPQIPPLHAVAPQAAYCAGRPGLVLAAEGAPLTFSTGYAHDMVLRLKGKNGELVDLPARADAEKGGFVVDTAGLDPDNFDAGFDGALHGHWGFESYEGPQFHFRNAQPQHWRIVDDDGNSLVVGRDGTIHLQAQGAACIENITLQQPAGQPQKVAWKSTQPDELVATLPLKDARPGPLTLLVKQYGRPDADAIPLQAFAHASDLDSFTFHAGDVSGVLRGARLDDVKALTLGGVEFKPAPAPAAGNDNELLMVAADAPTAGKLRGGQAATARIALQDGRVVSLAVSVKPPRPRASLIGKSIQPSAQGGPSLIQLTGKDELAQNARLTFSIRAQAPTTFSANEKVEVANTRGDILATLTPTTGLTLEDSQVALATLDTEKAFGSSAFGALRFRVVDDAAGDWQPLATLVRLPVLRDLTCPAASDQPCQLTGSNLFLIDSLAADADFAAPAAVPEGFPGDALPVPHPTAGRLYLKLHDDPSVVNLAAFPAAAPSASASAEASRPPLPAAAAPP